MPKEEILQRPMGGVVRHGGALAPGEGGRHLLAFWVCLLGKHHTIIVVNLSQATFQIAPFSILPMSKVIVVGARFYRYLSG